MIRDDGLVDHATRLGARGLDRCRQIAATTPGVRAVRGLGLYFGIELESAARAEAVMYACLARGLSFKIGGGTVLTLCPPLVISQADLDAALDIVADALAATS